MKTQQEQLDFAQELQSLTAEHGELLNKLAISEDKASVLSAIKDVTNKMSKLRDTYIGAE